MGSVRAPPAAGTIIPSPTATARYTIEGHRGHNVVYQTARSDLLDLAERGLLTAAKPSNRWQFAAVDDLESRLSTA